MHYPTLIDVYGKGLPWTSMQFYKGSIKNKYDALAPYDYSLCFENCSQRNYFSEKFTDAILSWTIPIYWGCPNIDEYFPPGSYYYIDITQQNAAQKIIEIINQPITVDNIQALKSARELILNTYNVWPTIEKLVNTK